MKLSPLALTWRFLVLSSFIAAPSLFAGQRPESKNLHHSYNLGVAHYTNALLRGSALEKSKKRAFIYDFDDCLVGTQVNQEGAEIVAYHDKNNVKEVFEKILANKDNIIVILTSSYGLLAQKRLWDKLVGIVGEANFREASRRIHTTGKGVHHFQPPVYIRGEVPDLHPDFSKYYHQTWRTGMKFEYAQRGMVFFCHSDYFVTPKHFIIKDFVEKFCPEVESIHFVDDKEMTTRIAYDYWVCLIGEKRRLDVVTMIPYPFLYPTMQDWLKKYQDTPVTTNTTSSDTPSSGSSTTLNDDIFDDDDDYDPELAAIWEASQKEAAQNQEDDCQDSWRPQSPY